MTRAKRKVEEDLPETEEDIRTITSAKSEAFEQGAQRLMVALYRVLYRRDRDGNPLAEAADVQEIGRRLRVKLAQMDGASLH
jgi:hypothetical protein